MERHIARYGSDIVAATMISHRILASDDNFARIETESGESQPGAHTPQDYNKDAAIALKNRIVDEWSSIHSERIVNEITYILGNRMSDLSPIDADTQNELQLLKALALERSLSSDWAEAEEAYHKCRSGQFQLSVVLNNLGVLQAKRQRGKEAIELLRESIRVALAYQIRIKAPFYNYVLILEQLHRQSLIFVAGYLAGLDETLQLVTFAAANNAPEAIRSFRKDSSKDTWTEAEIEAAYKRVAQYAHDMNSSERFFEKRVSFLDPQRDLFGSFGDVVDRRDRAGAQTHFQRAISLAEEEKFAESLEEIKIASWMDPDLSIQAERKTEQVSDLWRRKKNERLRALLEDKEFDGAAETIRYLPDDSLKRRGDQGVIATIQRQKHIHQITEADHFILQGDKTSAESIYFRLLAEDLDEDLRRYASHKLMEIEPDD